MPLTAGPAAVAVHHQSDVLRPRLADQLPPESPLVDPVEHDPLNLSISRKLHQPAVEELHFTDKISADADVPTPPRGEFV
ncbi:hypothetical protein OG394_15110 [Kribbella sp. NBC_01245]|uniref:hypothetical protein n=1 Tax=Kribbella sp. NBC_01245 TaxID=2903578 RepID=UPI002E27C753|nr:hypothetical protein [Kribbella sp. NBC_01245]